MATTEVLHNQKNRIAPGRKGAKASPLAERLREQIVVGNYRPGDRLPSFAEMRREYGIASLTVERLYLELEREGLVRREHGRGVFVQDRATKHKKKPVVSFLWPGGTGSPDPTWLHLLQGVQSAALEHRLNLQLIHSIPSAMDEVDWDGLLFASGMPEVARNLPPQIPNVSLLFPYTGIAAAVADDFQGAQLAIAHLVALGHRQIGYIGTGGNAVTLNRRTGYIAGLQNAGVEPRDTWVRIMKHGPTASSGFMDAGRETMFDWLQDEWAMAGCTALLAQNDEIAIGAMQALRLCGIRVPHDVSVIGFEGTEVGLHCTPHLSSVGVPFEEIGGRGMALLVRLIEAKARGGTSGTPEVMTSCTTLLERESTAPCRIGSARN